MSQNLKKEHQTTKKALLQNFSNLINQNGGISVTRLQLLSACLQVEENELQSALTVVNSFALNKQVLKTATNENLVEQDLPDFTSKQKANELIEHYPFLKSIITEFGVFTYTEILNAFKAKLGADFPIITIEELKDDFLLTIKSKFNRERYTTKNKNLCNALCDALILFKPVFEKLT